MSGLEERHRWNREWRRGSCPSGKKEYPTRADAKFARNGKSALRKQRGPDRLSAYLCSACGAWHLGRLETWRRRGEEPA